MSDVHELHKYLSNRWHCIATMPIRTRNHHVLDRPELSASLLHIVLQILQNLLVIQILWVAHVQELYDATRHFAKRVRGQCQLDIWIRDILI